MSQEWVPLAIFSRFLKLCCEHVPKDPDIHIAVESEPHIKDIFVSELVRLVREFLLVLPFSIHSLHYPPLLKMAESYYHSLLLLNFPTIIHISSVSQRHILVFLDISFHYHQGRC
jgi:hypothetical protein